MTASSNGALKAELGDCISCSFLEKHASFIWVLFHATVKILMFSKDNLIHIYPKPSLFLLNIIFTLGALGRLKEMMEVLQPLALGMRLPCHQPLLLDSKQLKGGKSLYPHGLTVHELEWGKKILIFKGLTETHHFLYL